MHPVKLYLASRCLYPDPWPDDLCYHPKLRHFETGKCHPSMVVPYRDETGEVKAVHRTYLTMKGTKLERVSSAKLNLGSPKGCAIRLAPATTRVALTEGIEDALTVTQLYYWPCWAVGNVAGLTSVILPDAITEVMICADADEAGLRAADKAAERFVKQGRKVDIITPDGAKDFNEMLMKQKKDA